MALTQIAPPLRWDPRRHVRALFRFEAVRGFALLSPTMIIMVVALAAPLILLALYSFWTQDGLALDTHFTFATPSRSGVRPIAHSSTARSRSPGW